MSKIIILFILFFSFQPSNKPISGQELKGVWHDALSADGWGDTYQFLSDNNFIFHFSQMVDNKYASSLKGKYRIEEGHIILTVANIEYVSSKPEKVSFYDGHWVVEPTAYTWQSLDKPVEASIEINRGKSINGHQCIILDGTNYYKMSKDPKKYP